MGELRQRDPAGLLTADQATEVARSLDEICPDTFCGGDYTYFVESVACSGRGECTIGYSAEPFDEEGGFPADALEGVDLDSLVRSGDGGNGPYEGRVLRAETVESAVRLVLSCRLDDRYREPADVCEEERDTIGYSEQLYNHFLDCLWAMEEVLEQF